MPERTAIEKLVRTLIASDVTYRPLKSFGERGVRRLDKTTEEVSSLLKDGEEVGERVFARVERLDEQKARTLREAVNDFSSEYPKYGELLDKIIKEKRTKHNRYLVYGLQEGFKLSDEDYMGVIMSLGFDRRTASGLYTHILAMSEDLGRQDEHDARKILIARK